MMKLNIFPKDFLRKDLIDIEILLSFRFILRQHKKMILNLALTNFNIIVIEQEEE